MLRAIRAEKGVGRASASSNRVGVQRLGAAQRRRQRLDRGADDVVVGVLLGQRDARGLAVGAQHQALRLLRLEVLLHQRRPEVARGAQLGDLHEEVHADAEEEREARREGVDVEARGEGGAHIFQAVGDGEGEFLHAGRPGFLHVIAGDRDRVEARHVLRRVGDDVGDDPHRGFRRVDVGVADHELLEDVVLDGPVEVLLGDPLLLARDDEHRQHRQHRAVHGHRDRHLVERDAVEQDLHVLDAVDRHAGLADIADRPADGRCRSRDGWPGRRRPGKRGWRQARPRQMQGWRRPGTARPAQSPHLAGLR